MRHDGNSPDHDEVDAAGRQCPQMPLVIGLEGLLSHSGVSFEVREAAIAL